MFAHLSPILLALAFGLAVAAVWKAGLPLSKATESLSKRFGLGQALGGVIILAFATNLPEIAITISAALSGRLDVAVGNILGGIAAQTVVLAILDAIESRKGEPLTHRAASLELVLEGVLVLSVLGAVVMGAQFAPHAIFVRITPGAAVIVLLWIVGVALVGKARAGLPWQATGDAPGGQGKAPGAKEKKPERGGSRSLATFAAAAGVTLVGGVVLERAGDSAAGQLGMSGAIFGATVLAAATSLPELSTGLASIRMRDDELAVSDIFGGNAFLPTLFLLATLVSGRAVLPALTRPTSTSPRWGCCSPPSTSSA